MAIGEVTREQAKLRLALSGPSGAGKTYTALNIATHMGGRICVFDTEYGSAAKYSSGKPFRFSGDTIEGNYHPQKYLDKLAEAVADNFDIVIFDSLSHAWNGPGGILEIVSNETKRRNGNSYAAWDYATPIYRSLIHGLLAAKCHVIVTLRAKQDYVQEKNEKTGRTDIRKVGMAPEIRDGFSYEMDIEGLLDIDHNFIVGKTRCEEIDGRVFHKPGKELADILMGWLNDGAPAVEKPVPAPPSTAEVNATASAPVMPPTDWRVAANTYLKGRSDETGREWKFANIPAFQGEGEMKLKLQSWGMLQVEQGNDPLVAFKALAEEAHKETADVG